MSTDSETIAENHISSIVEITRKWQDGKMFAEEAIKAIKDLLITPITWKEKYDVDGDPEHAMDFLKTRGFYEIKNIICPPTADHNILKDEMSAIIWLLEEWDWGWHEHLPEHPLKP